MNNSLNLHHLKGREGKGTGKRKGRRVETFTTSSSYVLRQPADGVVTR
jgi:hypothetical protein